MIINIININIIIIIIKIYFWSNLKFLKNRRNESIIKFISNNKESNSIIFLMISMIIHGFWLNIILNNQILICPKLTIHSFITFEWNHRWKFEDNN
jgi:hypothetical protein